MDNGHAVLAPSSAAVRVACSGSRALSALNPETEPSQDSLEGHAAHWAASELFAGRMIDTGLIAPNGIMLTDEMVEAAEMYVNDVVGVWGPHAAVAQLYVEQPVSIATIHPECWGTPDAWTFIPATLYVWDFKFGHRYVEVFENWQLIEYVAGILEQLGVDGIADQHIDVVMRIVQPRCYVGGAPIREWRVRASDLRGAFNHLRNREAAAMEPNAPTTVNEHCRDCRGRHLCPALQRAAYSAMDIAASSVPFNLDPAALGNELRFVDKAIAALEARRTGLAEQALATIRTGQPVPFYSVEQGYGRERWVRPDDEVIAMGEVMGLQLSKPKLVTPKQAIKAGLPEEVVKAFSEVPRGELKLVPDDGSKARKIFNNS